MTTSSSTLFHESQPFRVWWLWLILLIPVAVSWWTFIVQIVLGTPVGNHPAPDIVTVMLWLLFGFGLPLFAYYTRLITDVHADGVHLRFFPLYSRTIALDDIVAYQARQYSPIREYGGWGIRYGERGNRAFIVGGTGGVELELADKTRVLIGSQRSEEFASAISAAKALV
jgi:hypothetical protein